jgi:small subunit ribosomal protein S2
VSVNIDIKKLLESGVHFGHKTSRWHPKMAPYIHSKRQDSHIIDLTKTVEALEVALPELTKIIARGGKVLLVGTKKQVRPVIKEVAEATGQPYVTERWIGGTLTNAKTVGVQVKKLHTLEKRMETGELEKRYSKLEVQRYAEEIESLNEKYGGIKELSGQPAALVVVDVCEERNAVKEAKTLGIPVFALVDTNADPSDIDHVIPANDDAIKGVQLLLGYIGEAIQEGLKNAKKTEDK